MGTSQDNEALAATADPVPERLLDVAERLFADRGFDGTSIRDLATAAGCNIASVNYYFGSKERLYEEVFRRHLLPMRDMRIASINRVMADSKGNPKLEDLLRAFANAFVEPLTDQGRAARFMKLMGREIVNSHLPVDVFVKDVVIPTMTAMQAALLKVCPGLDPAKVPMLVYSIVGQLLHAVHTRPILEKAKTTEMPKFPLAEVIDHIVEFSAIGIRAYATEEAK